MLIHPAHTFSFDELSTRLKTARDNRLVYERRGPDGLVLYVYSEQCVFEGAWDDVTVAARGLILDIAARRIAATPFPKFFNAGELGRPVPNLPFDAFEKLDGSLIIIFHHGGRWRTATKGAFESSQAVWAQSRLQRLDLSHLDIGTTYLAEATYPENRIVVRHTSEAMRLLGAYDGTGRELPWEQVATTGERLGVGTAKRTTFQSIQELMDVARGLPKSDEGYVVRFTDGTRLKIKGEEYKRIHALISGLTPLAMWQAMSASMNMTDIRRDLPEEVWGDFDQIIALLEGQVQSIVASVAETARQCEGLTDKEVGLQSHNFSQNVRSLIFDYRKLKGNILTGRTRDKIFRLIRPDANVLPGYQPSHAIRRVVDEGR